MTVVAAAAAATSPHIPPTKQLQKHISKTIKQDNFCLEINL